MNKLELIYTGARGQVRHDGKVLSPEADGRPADRIHIGAGEAEDFRHLVEGGIFTPADPAAFKAAEDELAAARAKASASPFAVHDDAEPKRKKRGEA